VVPAVVVPATLTIHDLARIFHVRHETIAGWVRRGTFPPPLSCSNRKRLWNAATIEAFLAETTGPGAAADVEKVLAGRAGSKRGER
jgi:hypothetical protein